MDKKIVEYKIIRKEAQVAAIEKEVNDHLAKNEGWVPLGNITAIVKIETRGASGQVIEYIQAIGRLSPE